MRESCWFAIVVFKQLDVVALEDHKAHLTTMLLPNLSGTDLGLEPCFSPWYFPNVKRILTTSAP